METNLSLGISTGTETILLIENEPGMRQLVSQMLLLAGYTVWEASSGPEAVHLIEQRARPADLLLTDSGAELAESFARQYPNIRVLFTSEDKVVTSKGVQFLPKPFSPGALMCKVREVLDQPWRCEVLPGANVAEDYPADIARLAADGS
jgi:two-component system, cell cycle sensor histidine kinase and response regulator CckA